MCNAVKSVGDASNGLSTRFTIQLSRSEILRSVADTVRKGIDDHDRYCRQCPESDAELDSRDVSWITEDCSDPATVVCVMEDETCFCGFLLNENLGLVFAADCNSSRDCSKVFNVYRNQIIQYQQEKHVEWI